MTLSCPRDIAIFARLKALKLPIIAVHAFFLPASLRSITIVVHLTLSDNLIDILADGLDTIIINCRCLEELAFETPKGALAYQDHLAHGLLLLPDVRRFTVPMAILNNDMLGAIATAPNLDVFRFGNPRSNVMFFQNITEFNVLATRPVTLPVAGFAKLQGISLCCLDIHHLEDILLHEGFPSHRITFAHLSFLFGPRVPALNLRTVTELVSIHFSRLRCLSITLVQQEFLDEIFEEPYLPPSHFEDLSPLFRMDLERLTVLTPTAIQMASKDMGTLARWRSAPTLKELVLSPSPRRSGDVPTLPVDVLSDVSANFPALEVLGLRLGHSLPHGVPSGVERFRSIQELQVGQVVEYRSDPQDVCSLRNQLIIVARFLFDVLQPGTIINRSLDSWFEVDLEFSNRSTPYIQDESLLTTGTWEFIESVLKLLWKERDGQAERHAQYDDETAWLRDALQAACVS